MARQLQGFPNATEASAMQAPPELFGDRSTLSSNKQNGRNKVPGGGMSGGGFFSTGNTNSGGKTGKLDAEKAQQRVQRLLKDFRHGVIRFEGPGTEARYLLPPHGLEDPALILRAMVESGLWGLDLPTVIFQCDDLLYGGSGEDGGYYFQAKGGEPAPVDWRWNQSDWQKTLGYIPRNDVAKAVTKMHKSRMATVARCCQETAQQQGLSPWFFSSAPCMGGGDGGNMVADFLADAVQAPIFVGAPSPAHGLFDESVDDAGGGLTHFIEEVAEAVENVFRGKKNQATRLLPFVLQACPTDDLQNYAVRLKDIPRQKFIYPDMTDTYLVCDKESNLRWLNPAVSHYVFFRKSQAKLQQAFEQLVEMRLCSTVRIVAGPSNSPEYARSLFEHARRRRGSLTVLLDKSTPMATRIAASLKRKGGQGGYLGDTTPRSGMSQQVPPSGMGWLMPMEQNPQSQAASQPMGASTLGWGQPLGRGASSTIYDLTPVDVPQDVESMFQVVPFLEDASDQAFMNRLAEVLYHRLPVIRKSREVADEPHPERLDKTWELAARLAMGAERREARFRMMIWACVCVMVVCVSYAILSGYDKNFEPRPCEPMYAPIHWTRRLWAYQCRYRHVLRFMNAFLPFIAVALLMKLCLPTSLQHNKQAVWLRSASRELVREIYRYRCGLGNYGSPITRWMNSPATLTPQSDDFGTPSNHLTFDEFIARVAERTRLNTGIVVDTLITPTAKEVKTFKEFMIGAYVPPPKPGNDSMPSTPRSSASALTPAAPLMAAALDELTMTRSEQDGGTCRMNHEIYVNYRLKGQRDHLISKRNKMKCGYELYWAFVIVCAVAAAVFAYMRMNLTMVVSMAVLTGAMILSDIGEVPLCLKTTIAVVRVLDDYIEQWEELSARERQSPSKFQALVNGVEEVILLENPFYLDDSMSLRGRNLYEGQLIEIADELDVPIAGLYALHRNSHRFSGPRVGAPEQIKKVER